MKKMKDLQEILRRIDGRGYKAYKDIQGEYEGDWYRLLIDHVQGDPFASPSRIRIIISQEKARFPEDTFMSRIRQVALRDFLTRSFHSAIAKILRGGRGTGKSGLIEIDRPGQEILERTSVLVNGSRVEARFLVGLPAFGRRIAGQQAEAIFFTELPRIIEKSMLYGNLNSRDLYRHIETAEDADYLRKSLRNRGLVAFVADGSILPRKSGVDQRPLDQGRIIPFASPESLRVTFILPNRGETSGMGIPHGITLIVGGGYHGKSTLLNALELGIYNHVPDDGRELVISDPASVKIRAEDGRRIEKTCITPFISNLPFGQDTDSFRSDDASGSTSQAANIIEAIEAGAGVLLIDEDTSATNFMIRDHRMQELVPKDHEPITPFIDRVQQLYKELVISTILVIGGSGDYFDVAHTTICMMEYLPLDLSDDARAVAEKYRAERKREGREDFGKVIQRIPISGSFDAARGRREVSIKAGGLDAITFGTHRIDLSSVEQIVDGSQTRAIGDAIHYATVHMKEDSTLREIIERVLDDIAEEGLDILSPWPVGNYAEFRGIELAAAINRLRTLRVKQR